MKLLPKLNLILLVLFALGGLIIAEFTKTLLLNNARSEVLREAELMMASARSVRDYTASDLAPLLEQNPQHQEKFLPETVPAFAAINTFQRLRENYPDYTYHEATLNPPIWRIVRSTGKWKLSEGGASMALEKDYHSIDQCHKGTYRFVDWAWTSWLTFKGDESPAGGHRTLPWYGAVMGRIRSPRAETPHSKS